ncbi:hypothetical protein B1R32_12431 [Abditibacterium utsteinense]|uniref:AhpC/TSA family protein n=2 Tax=Abditibacterium utsteinense TaxID=1960156 RepID=A0A2S8SPI7_9BACT|nr:hypothetical protein B1R32_12431 [Abditibacterium utsteinense]
MALFNKWGNLGVANRPLLERTFDDLANAAAWQLERGDRKGATQSAQKLLSLELFDAAPQDAKTGRARTELSVYADDLQMPSKAVGFVMHRNGKEPAAASRLAQVWLAKLPAYIAGSATREEKLRVAEISQLLGTEVFALDAGRTQTIAEAVDSVRGSYGPGALVVLPQFVPTVEAAKRERVARQVEAFSNPREVGAPAANTPAANTSQSNAPTRLSRTAQELEDATTQGAPEAQPQISARTPTQKPAPKPVEMPLVPAVDFLMRSLRTGKKMRLSDFKGKTVILYFWDAFWMENHDVSPTPAEKLFAFSKRYDSQKVVFLLVDKNGGFREAVQNYQKLTDPTPDTGRDQRRGHGPRLYPQVAYSLEIGIPEAAGDTPPEQVVTEAALTFYTGSKNVSRSAMRVTVISPAGQVVGSVDFEEDLPASVFNANQLYLDSYRVYDLDEAALEDLLVRATGIQP